MTAAPQRCKPHSSSPECCRFPRSPTATPERPVPRSSFYQHAAAPKPPRPPQERLSAPHLKVFAETPRTSQDRRRAPSLIVLHPSAVASRDLRYHHRISPHAPSDSRRPFILARCRVKGDLQLRPSCPPRDRPLEHERRPHREAPSHPKCNLHGLLRRPPILLTFGRAPSRSGTLWPSPKRTST
jgi:hypothetical protein